MAPSGHPGNHEANFLASFFQLDHRLFKRPSSNLENGELRSIADELSPFRAEHTIDLMSILDDDDMKASGLYDEKTIMEKFHEANE